MNAPARRRAAIAAAACLGALAMVVGSASAAGAATAPAPVKPRLIDSSYFGLNSPATSVPSAVPAEAAEATHTSASMPTPVPGAATTSLPTLPSSTFGTIRFWDDPPTLSTRWCDLQPTPTSDIEEQLTLRLDPKLDAAAAAKARRVVLVLGHAAPWVFDAEGVDATTTTVPWFCGGEASSMAVPSIASFGTNENPGPALSRWSAYVGAVLAHINTKYSDGAPFEVALQTFNEPNWLLKTTTGLPNTATTMSEAAAALTRLDAIIRVQLRLAAKTGTTPFRLYTSPISCANTPFSKAYLTLANTAQAASRRYDGVSMQTYSFSNKGARTTDELITGYNTGAIRGVTALLDSLPALRGLPRHQTETNHGLATTGSPLAISISGQRVLTARLLVDGLRWNLASQVLYTANPGIMGVKLGLDSSGAGSGDARLLSTVLEVRRWLLGRTFTGCVSSTGRVICSLADRGTNKPRRVVFSETGTWQRLAVPSWATTVRTIEGSQRSVRPGSILTVTSAPLFIS